MKTKITTDYIMDKADKVIKTCATKEQIKAA
jgi:hypothetical protein